MAALVRAGEEQLGVLPDAEEAAAQLGEHRLAGALSRQQRVADIFETVPDPSLQLVTRRQLAVVHGLLGEYGREAELRDAVVEAARALPPPAAAAATAAALHERSVSALRAGDTASAATAADAAVEAAAALDCAAASALCHGWRGTVSAAAGEGEAAAAQLEVALESAPSAVRAELWLQLGSARLAAAAEPTTGKIPAEAEEAFQQAVSTAAEGAVPARLCGVVARVKLGEGALRFVEAEAEARMRTTRHANQDDVAAKQALDEALDEAEEGLNEAVLELKEALGEGCPWVGGVVRRLAALHQIKGDAIMAEVPSPRHDDNPLPQRSGTVGLTGVVLLSRGCIAVGAVDLMRCRRTVPSLCEVRRSPS